MRRINEPHLAWPWIGSRSIRDHLLRAGYPVCCDRVRRLMRKIDIYGICHPSPTSLPGPGHKIYRDLLEDVVIERPKQIRAANITYLPMAGGAS